MKYFTVNQNLNVLCSLDIIYNLFTKSPQKHFKLYSDVRLRGFYGIVHVDKEETEIVLTEARSGEEQIRWKISSVNRVFCPKTVCKRDKNKILVVITNRYQGIFHLQISISLNTILYVLCINVWALHHHLVSIYILSHIANRTSMIISTNACQK